MIFHVLGSCSGTEPMPDRHHTSVTLETGGKLYYFDAGENCCHRSYLMGIDQQRTDSIFISHTHMDHIGGLPHLLWNLWKITTLSPEHEARVAGKTVRVFLPNLDVFDGMIKMLHGAENDYNTVFTVEPHLVEDGVLLDGGVKVGALHNYHLGAPQPGEPWKSFSYSIEAEGKKVFYSGDFRDLSELLPQMDGSALVFLETGHHRACDLCQELVDRKVDFGKVVFFHHGLEILHDFHGELALAQKVLGDRMLFAYDGLRLEV